MTRSFAAWLLTTSLLLPGPAFSLSTVDWVADANADGAATGSLGGVTVTFTSTSASNGGGTVFNTNWATNLGSDGVPGIGDSGVVSEAVRIYSNAHVVTISFGASISNPVLLFNFLQPGANSFRHLPGGLMLLDENPAGSMTISGNDIFADFFTHMGTANDGVAIRLSGDFTEISFEVLDMFGGDSVGFTVAADVCGNGATDNDEGSVGGNDCPAEADSDELSVD